MSTDKNIQKKDFSYLGLNNGNTVGFTNEEKLSMLQQINKDIYFTLKTPEGEEHLITTNGIGLVEVSDIRPCSVKEQEFKIKKVDDVVWTPYVNHIHPIQKVSLVAKLNNAVFTLDKAENGSFVVFCQPKGMLHHNVTLKSVCFDEAIKEASAIAITKTSN